VDHSQNYTEQHRKNYTSETISQNILKRGTCDDNFYIVVDVIHLIVFSIDSQK